MFQILCWNVRGLNSAARCLAVHETIAATTCHIACLQETKLEAIDDSLARFLGAYKLNQFVYKPAQGTRGGILLLWDDRVVDMQNPEIGRYSITSIVTVRDTAASFILTSVYGPSRRVQKESFLRHLRQIKPTNDARWLLLGDFNLIHRARDKNNRNLNLSLMRSFRRTLNFCEPKEIHLQNRRFTWSNERRSPTLVRLDRFFCNQGWDMTFDEHALHALSTSHSDHCSLLLAHMLAPR